jgi:myosin-crossreactive antigen
LEDYSDEDKDTILTEAESIRWEISAKYSMINIGINDEDLPQTTTDSLGRKTSIYLEDDKYIIEKEPDENG